MNIGFSLYGLSPIFSPGKYQSYRHGFQGSEMDNEVKGKGNSYTTEFRQLDPRLGRWLSIDPKAVSFPSVSPYISMGNNPICFNDTKGDSVPTTFKDESGNTLSTIPDRIQKMFNEEYGITIGYNATTGMMYKSGDCSTTLTVSPMAKKEWEKQLGVSNGNDKIIFGFNLGAGSTPITFGGNVDSEKFGSTTYVDLADFDENGAIRGAIYGGQELGWGDMEIPIRAMNLARVVEHEYLGHGIFDYEDDSFFSDQNGGYTAATCGQNNHLLCNPIRKELGVPLVYDHVMRNGQLTTTNSSEIISVQYAFMGHSEDQIKCPSSTANTENEYKDCYGGVAFPDVYMYGKIAK